MKGTIMKACNKLAALFVAPLCLGVSMPSDAQEPLEGAYTIQQVSTGRHVDAYENKAYDYRLATRDREEDKSQDWIIEPVGPDLYTIKQQKTQRYIDAYEKKKYFPGLAKSDYWVVTRTRGRESNQSQKWIIRPVHTGFENAFTIQQKSTTRYLDAYSSAKDHALAMRGKKTNQSQQWILERVDGDVKCHDPVYDLNRAKFGEHTQKLIAKRESDNRLGETELVEEFRVSEKVKEEYWFETTKGSYLKVGLSVSVPIPQLGATKASISMGAGTYQEKTSGEHKAREKSWENAFQARCPASHYCVYEATVIEALVSVPYTAHCTIASISKSREMTGVWKGVSSWDLDSKTNHFTDSDDRAPTRDDGRSLPFGGAAVAPGGGAKGGAPSIGK